MELDITGLLADAEEALRGQNSSIVLLNNVNVRKAVTARLSWRLVCIAAVQNVCFLLRWPSCIQYLLLLRIHFDFLNVCVLDSTSLASVSRTEGGREHDERSFQVFLYIAPFNNRHQKVFHNKSLKALY